MTGAVLSPAPEHEFRQTADKDEAMDVITRVYVPHDLVLPERTLDMTLAWTPLHSLVLGHLSYGAEAHLIAPKLETFYHVNVTLRGHTRSRRGRDEVSTGPDVGAGVPAHRASSRALEHRLSTAGNEDRQGRLRDRAHPGCSVIP